MDFSTSAITYALLLFPMFFAFTVIFQGMGKVARNEHDGRGVVGFGIFLLILIIVAFFVFIR